MKLFDSDVLIAHLRGDDRATSLLVEAVQEGDGACSVLSRFELMAGMRSDERQVVRRLLDGLLNLPISEEIAGIAAQWGRQFRRSHSSIGAIDYLVAATAEYHDARLLTLNVRHFPMFEQLTPAF